MRSGTLNQDQNSSKEVYPLFLTPDAVSGHASLSALFERQIHILLQSGVPWGRLNPRLRAAFLLGYYLGNVRNGGHSQFIGNAYKYYGGDPAVFLEWAMSAAQLYDMQETLAIMRNVHAWILTNPKVALAQTGFTPHRSKALEPFDKALYDADLLEEAEWLKQVKALPGHHAEVVLRYYGYEAGFVRFPAMVSIIKEVAFLAAFEPVRVIETDDFDAAVKDAAANDPIAKASRMSLRLAELKESFPKPATCAVLSVLLNHAFLADDELLRVGAAQSEMRKGQGVLTTTPGKKAFIFQIGTRRTSVFEATGDPDALLENMISFPDRKGGPVAELIYRFHPKYRVQRRLSRLTRQRLVRKTRRIGSVPNAVGRDVSERSKQLFVPEALALWLEDAQEMTTPAFWRLLSTEADCMRWRFRVADSQLEVTVRSVGVSIINDGVEAVYSRETLRSVREFAKVEA